MSINQLDLKEKHMEKPAQTLHPVHDLIRRRWSPRAFSSQSVPSDVLWSLLEAARWAPSCYGEEPWRYIVATKENPEEFQKMLSGLVENNQTWSKGAPVLMIGITKKTYTRTGKPNEHCRHDLGQASAQLTLEAVSRGLFVHQMGGILPEKIRETYAVPEDFDILTAVAIGYPGDAEALPPGLQKAEKGSRARRDPKDLFFKKHWGEPL